MENYRSPTLWIRDHPDILWPCLKVIDILCNVREAFRHVDALWHWLDLLYLHGSVFLECSQFFSLFTCRYPLPMVRIFIFWGHFLNQVSYSCTDTIGCKVQLTAKSDKMHSQQMTEQWAYSTQGGGSGWNSPVTLCTSKSFDTTNTRLLDANRGKITTTNT